MKRKLIGLAVGLVVVLSLQGLTFASVGENGVEKEVDGLKVELAFMEGEAKSGNNEIMVKLHNEKDEPLADAKVKLTADMDRKPETHGMDMQKFEPIVVELESSHEEGQYMGEINLSDSGEWIFKVSIITEGQEKNVDFDLDVVKGGPNWAVIGGFSGFIILIIIIAAVKKGKKTVET